MEPIITLMARVVVQAVRDIRCEPGRRLPPEDIRDAAEFLKSDVCRIILDSVGVDVDPSKLEELKEV